NLGPASGGQTVTITGSNFVVGGTSVSFAGSPGTSVNVSSSTQLTVVTPAGTPGFANVVVTTIGGSVSNTNAYTYLSAEIPSKKQTQMQTTATYLGGGLLWYPVRYC
ncbi:IPT/TIG domain-containing protein, partial [Legionella brunensis]